MHLIVASRADKASMSMENFILESTPFKDLENGGDLYEFGEYRLKIIEKRHLNYDLLPAEERGITADISDITFLSSHSSSAEIKSLTVHPTGNFGEAVLGGRSKKLSMSSPEKMTPALRKLAEAYRGNGFEITLESTHHGPYLEIPSFYIEIGTTEKEWKDASALQAVKEAVFTDADTVAENFVGVGGGHYMPKVTKYVMENKLNVGHLISKHDQDTITREQIEEAIENTPRCRGFIMDRKGCRGPVRAIIREITDDRGLELIKL